jgi:hypothetical protein
MLALRWTNRPDSFDSDSVRDRGIEGLPRRSFSEGGFKSFRPDQLFPKTLRNWIGHGWRWSAVTGRFRTQTCMLCMLMREARAQRFGSPSAHNLAMAGRTPAISSYGCNGYNFPADSLGKAKNTCKLGIAGEPVEWVLELTEDRSN